MYHGFDFSDGIWFDIQQVVDGTLTSKHLRKKYKREGGEKYGDLINRNLSARIDSMKPL